MMDHGLRVVGPVLSGSIDYLEWVRHLILCDGQWHAQPGALPYDG